jgi:hypothetical protein
MNYINAIGASFPRTTLIVFRARGSRRLAAIFAGTSFPGMHCDFRGALADLDLDICT